MVVYTFIDKDGTRHHRTYPLTAFRANINAFMKNGRLTLEDPDFIDQSDVLNHVSDGEENYFPPIHLIDTICFKCPSKYMKEAQERGKATELALRKARSSNEGGLFPYYIEDP